MNTQKYIYDPIKEASKHCHLLDLYHILPTLRKDIKIHLDSFRYTHTDIIYLILAIIDICNFRVGNRKYKKSTGIATLKNGHITIHDNCSNIAFYGKRQVINHCEILSDKMNTILMNLSEYKDDNDFIFTYKDVNNKEHRINADHINELLGKYGNITTKMFRTWKANYYFIKTLKYLDIPQTKTAINKNISLAVTTAANKLHHTPAICRKSYIDSRIVKQYREYSENFIFSIKNIGNENPYLLDGEEDLMNVLDYLC